MSDKTTNFYYWLTNVLPEVGEDIDHEFSKVLKKYLTSPAALWMHEFDACKQDGFNPGCDD